MEGIFCLMRQILPPAASRFYRLLTITDDAAVELLEDDDMKVNGPNEIKSNAISRRKKTSGSGERFSIAGGETSETESTHATAHAGPVAALDSLLALQEVDEREARKPFKRGYETLDLLDDIRHGLLMGGIPVSKLKALTRLIAQERSQVSDPDLAAILDEIDLRAQVELAKYAGDSL